MKTETIQGIKKVPELRNIEFEIPELATIDEPNSAPIIQTMEAIFDGVSIKVDVISKSIFSENTFYKKADRFLDVKIIVKGERNINIASLSIKVVKNKDETCEVYTVVGNTDRGLKGLGRTLWEVSLQLIQKISDKWNIPITQKVVRDPDESLGEKKWDDLFLPLLRIHKFLQIYEGGWEKIYLPHKK